MILSLRLLEQELTSNNLKSETQPRILNPTGSS